MKRRLVLAVVWAVGLAAIWFGLRATASRPLPFGPGWEMVGAVGDGPLVAVAEADGRDGRQWTRFRGPVVVWDVDGDRPVREFAAVPAEGWFVAVSNGRWLRVLPVEADGRDGVPAVFDLTDGREVCRAAGRVYWSFPYESGGRVLVPTAPRLGDPMAVTAFDPATGAVVWTADGYPDLITADHVATAPHRVGVPDGPWTVRRSSDGAVLGVVPGPARPLATDGRRLVAADGRVWEIATATALYQLAGVGPDGLGDTPWFAPGGLLVVLRGTPAGPAVCWHDTATGVEDESRRLPVPGNNSPWLVVRSDGRGEVRPRAFGGGGHWTDWFRGWLPFLPPPTPQRPPDPRLRFDALTGRRLPDGAPYTLVERPDGRPLVTGDPSGRPELVWRDRPRWLPLALAAGWTLAVGLVVWLSSRSTPPPPPAPRPPPPAAGGAAGAATGSIPPAAATPARSAGGG